MAATPWNPKETPYPPARRSSHVDIYKSASKGEVEVPDPYNWLEANTAETKEWVDKQVDFTEAYLAKGPKSQLYDAIKKNFNYARFGLASKKRDGYYYWYYNTGLQLQTPLYRARELPDPSKVESPGGEVFFDPNVLSEDGTAALAAPTFSHSAKYFAYGVSLSGSDFFTIYVRDASAPWTGNLDEGRLADEVQFCKFSGITWTHDDKGFFYQRFPSRPPEAADGDKLGTETTMDTNAQLYYHRIGTPQCEDILVMEDPEHEHYMWSTSISELDGRYLFLYTSKDTFPVNKLWVADLESQDVSGCMKWDKLVDDFKASYTYSANDGTLVYLTTNLDAPRDRIVTIDLAHPKEQRQLIEFLGEDKQGGKLESAIALPGGLWGIIWSRDIKDEVYLYSAEAKPIKRLLEGFIGSISASGDRDDNELWLHTSGFTEAGAAGRWILPDNIGNVVKTNGANGTHENGVHSKEQSVGKWELWRSTEVTGLSPDEFTSEQVWYESKDKTRIPMFVVKHKSTPIDGTAPAIQYGYGGFSIPIKPMYSPAVLTWIKHYSGVFAVPNIRGGGEYGEDWHQGGIREKKMNVFNDFIAATEYLVANKIAGKEKIAINGGSNGGLLVGACVNIAPENTFGAAVADVGVMDMLKFPLFTIGKAWEADFGAPSDPKDFDFIYPYSPLHNVDPKKIYPPMLLLTADHDDRVVPLHSYKLAAELQYRRADNPNPLLIRIDTKSGHGAGKSTEKRIQEAADKWGFVSQCMGLTWRD